MYNSCKVEYVLYRQLNVITVVCAFDNVIDKYIGCMFNTTFNTISVTCILWWGFLSVKEDIVTWRGLFELTGTYISNYHPSWPRTLYDFL